MEKLTYKAQYYRAMQIPLPDSACIVMASKKATRLTVL